MVVISTIRDAIEFVRAKRSRREPIRFHAHGAAEAIWRPRDRAAFNSVRARLRESGFGRACERLDALEAALRKRHGCPLPVPRKAMQNSDSSLSLWWGDAIMVRCFRDGFFGLIGGTKGIPAKRITPELLDVLAFHARIQAQ